MVIPFIRVTDIQNVFRGYKCNKGRAYCAMRQKIQINYFRIFFIEKTCET